MADQTRKPKPKREEEQPQAEATETTEEQSGEVDDLLDEIDEVLETNAEEFVRSFIQKGGE
jgi:prokaryotic ubiquitin-like protein Pup